MLQALTDMLGEPEGEDDVFEPEPETIAVYEECLASISRDSSPAGVVLKAG